MQPPSLRQRDCLIPRETGVKPSRCITEAFADIIAPCPRVLRLRAPHQKIFPNASRFAEFSPCPICDLGPDQACKFRASPIAEPGPDEMKEFVDQNQAKLAGSAKKSSLDNDLTPSDKGGGVDGTPTLRTSREQLAAVCRQMRLQADANRLAAQRGKPVYNA